MYVEIRMLNISKIVWNTILKEISMQFESYLLQEFGTEWNAMLQNYAICMRIRSMLWWQTMHESVEKCDFNNTSRVVLQKYVRIQ